MKKLIFLSILLLIFALCFASCQKDTASDTSPGTTDLESQDITATDSDIAVSTDVESTASTSAETYEETETDTETEADEESSEIYESTEEITSEEETTTESEETTTAPAKKYNWTMWNKKKDIVKFVSFDQLWEGASTSGINVFTPGQAASWDGLADMSISTAKALTFYGWVSVKGEVGTFGYSIDSTEPIFSEAWSLEAPDLEPHYIAMGGDTGSRMRIAINLEGLETGNHIITVLYKNAAGKEVALYKFKVKILALESVELPTVTPTTEATLPSSYNKDTSDTTYYGDGDYVLYTYKNKSASDHIAACKYYTDNGYTVYHTSEKAGNLFTTLTNGTAMAHIYWFGALEELNIVISSTAAYNLPPITPDVTDGEYECTVTQIEDYGHENGMSYVIQLKDGSYIIYDGAYATQAETLLNFLKENYKGEGKPTVRAWVLTHAHSDHYPTFITIARKYADEIKLEYVLATPLNDEVFEMNDEELYFSQYLAYDVARFEGAKLVYAHTGMEFTFCNLNMEVLWSPDDIYKNVTNTSMANRDVNFNNSSVVTRLYDSEYSALFNGDIGQRGTDVMEVIYGDYLKSDMCQASHHGVEDVPFSYYDKVQAQILFYPCDYNLYDNNTRHIMVRLKLELMDYTKEILIQGLSRHTRAWGTKYASDAPLSIPDYTPSANRPVYDGSLG